MAAPTVGEWATNLTLATDDLAEPDATKKQNGWNNVEEKPLRGHMNWLFQNLYDWVNYLNSQVTSSGGENFLRSNDPVQYSAGTITSADYIEYKFLDLTTEPVYSAYYTNRIAAGSFVLADGECLVILKDSSATTVTLTLGTYGTLAAGQYAIVAESSLSSSNSEDEVILFKRRVVSAGDDTYGVGYDSLECPVLGTKYISGERFYLGGKNYGDVIVTDGFDITGYSDNKSSRTFRIEGSNGKAIFAGSDSSHIFLGQFGTRSISSITSSNIVYIQGAGSTTDCGGIVISDNRTADSREWAILNGSTGQTTTAGALHIMRSNVTNTDPLSASQSYGLVLTKDGYCVIGAAASNAQTKLMVGSRSSTFSNPYGIVIEGNGGAATASFIAFENGEGVNARTWAIANGHSGQLNGDGSLYFFHGSAVNTDPFGVGQAIILGLQRDGSNTEVWLNGDVGIKAGSALYFDTNSSGTSGDTYAQGELTANTIDWVLGGSNNARFNNTGISLGNGIGNPSGAVHLWSNVGNDSVVRIRNTASGAGERTSFAQFMDYNASITDGFVGINVRSGTAGGSFVFIGYDIDGDNSLCVKNDGDVIIQDGSQLFLDGASGAGGDTFIYQSSANVIALVGGTTHHYFGNSGATINGDFSAGSGSNLFEIDSSGVILATLSSNHNTGSDTYELDLDGSNAGAGSHIGIRFSNGTYDFVFQFDPDATDPTGGGAAATGRIPVRISGATRYLAYY